MTTVFSFLLREFAKRSRLSGRRALQLQLEIPRSTFGYWWQGKNVPVGKVHRDQLFKLIPHPALSGPATKEKLAELIRPVTKRDQIELTNLLSGQPGASLTGGTAQRGPTEDVIERFRHLVCAILPDLKLLILTDIETRRRVKRELGEEVFEGLYVGINALSSDALYNKLETDGLLKQFTKGGE